ncbi:hypothetical protein F5Y15DRAFT_312050 [Xylariaceae sp. FL0016]|nr:hypothetical protein F5Y15DRAFT_312050 [Xylariaceae sp. FL0016]
MLLQLPTELVRAVAHAADPSDHLSLALTCRYTHACLQVILRYHKECCKLYRATSDVRPCTVLELLQDPIARFHVRTLEFWGMRRSWDDWKLYDLKWPPLQAPDSPCYPVPDPPGRRPYDSHFFRPREIDEVRDILTGMLATPSQDIISKYCTTIEDGHDAVLKVILMALCPRLNTVRLVQIEQEDNTPFFQFLSYLIGNITDTYVRGQVPRVAWPKGLASIERAAVNIDSMAHEGNHLIGTLPTAVLSLFRLPSICSLYLSGLDSRMMDAEAEEGEEEEEDDDDSESGFYNQEYGLTPGCSNVRQLFLDRSHCTLPLLEAILGASNKMEQIAFQHCEIDDFDFDQLLGAARYLHSLAVYSSSVHGYRSNMCYPDEGIGPCRMVAMSDCFLCSGYDDATDKLENLVNYFETFTGMSGSLVFLMGDSFFPSSEEAYEKDVDYVDHALSRLIKNGEFSNLKLLSLEDLELEHDTNRIRFHRTIRAGEKAGIKVCTRATPILDHPADDLLEGATEKELETSPYQHHPAVQEIVLLPHDGMSYDRGCSHCGACDRCYSWYRKELWDARQSQADGDSEEDEWADCHSDLEQAEDTGSVNFDDIRDSKIDMGTS